jgi:hypothetical protein
MSAIYNYDYVYDYVFYPNGVLEVRFTLGGYIQAVWNLEQETPYCTLQRLSVLPYRNLRRFVFRRSIKIRPDFYRELAYQKASLDKNKLPDFGSLIFIEHPLFSRELILIYNYLFYNLPFLSLQDDSIFYGNYSRTHRKL